MEPSPLVRTLCASSTRDTRAAHAALTPGTRLRQTLRDQGQLQEVAWSAYVATLPLAQSQSGHCRDSAPAAATAVGAFWALAAAGVSWALSAVGVFWAFAATPPCQTGT